LTERPLVWIALLAIGFPLLTIGLGLMRTRLRRSGSPLLSTVANLQNLVLPMGVLYFFVVFVLGSDQEGLAAKTLLTIALLTGLYAALDFTSDVVFGVAPEGSWRAHTPKLLRDIVIILLIGVGTLIVLSLVWEQDVTAIATALGVGSIVIGLALQETLGNAMSGIALLMERPFQEGDFIEVDGVEGTVKEINWRATRLEDRWGDIIVIPHSITSAAKIRNNTSTTERDAVLIEVGFGYEHPPADVKKMLLDMLNETEGVLSEPPPSVKTGSYGDSSVNYRMSFYIAHPLQKLVVSDRVMTRVWYAAQRAGIKIPFPIRTVYHHDADTPPSDARKSQALHTAGRVFAGGELDASALDQWGRGSEIRQFTDGESVLRQGEDGASLFLVISGTIELDVTRHGRRLTFLELSHGDVFGETTLLPGSRSPYGARAVGDASVLAVDSEIVHTIARERPSVAIQLGQIIDQRRKAANDIEAGASHRQSV